MTQNMSSKMMQSYMIQNRVSINYNTSASNTIINKIISADEFRNKNLLLSLGYSVYTRYYERVLNSSNISNEGKYNIQYMFESILSDLTSTEEKQLGIYKKTDLDISNELYEYETSLKSNPDFIFYCCTYHTNLGKILVIKNFKNYYKLTPGKKYLFDISDESNSGTTLSFSKVINSNEDLNGLYHVGTSGTSGACVILIPENTTYFYSICTFDKENTANSSYRIYGMIYTKIFIEDSNNLPYPNNALFYEPEGTYCLESGLDGNTILNKIEYNGPRYLVFSDICYNELVTDPSYVSYLWYDFYSSNKIKYGMYYGYYVINYTYSINRVTLLNKGVNSYGVSMENLIQIIDGSNRAKETHYLSGLDESGELDGYYDFYHTPFIIKVIGDFEKCSLYSDFFGYNDFEDILYFDSEYANNSLINPDGYDDISINKIVRLNPEGEIYFHDISSDVLNIENIYTNNSFYDADSINVNSQSRFSLNYKSGNSYDSEIFYGLYKGQYLIKNIPEDRPIAIINQEKTDCIKYFGPEEYKKTRLGPDGKTLYDFYYNTLIIEVYGNFGKVSIYEYNDGFCGGENILLYSEEDLILDISSEFQKWYEINDENINKTNNDCSNIDISFIDLSFSEIYQVESYINCTVDINSQDISAILFDDISNSTIKYCFDIGNYVIMNIPESNPIAFLNKGNEDKFYYDGYYKYKTVSFATDLNEYNYYWGNINITISEDFGKMSFETLKNGYMGGFKKLMFNSGDASSNGEAIHHWGINTYYDLKTSDVSDTPQNYYINVFPNIRPVAYSEDYITYRFSGYDRNGLIDGEEDNPELTFAIGDIIYFTFDSDNEYPFGIYTYHTILNDDQLIENNNNSNNSEISWIPNLVVNNYYYYRSQTYVNTFMGNVINIVSNPNAEITLDVSLISIIPSRDISLNNGYNPFFYGTENISIIPESFTIEFHETVNIKSNSYIYIFNKNNNTIDYKISAQSLNQANNNNNVVYTTNFSHYNLNSFEFDTSYAFLIDEDVFQNIYYNTISGDTESFTDTSTNEVINVFNLLEFGTEAIHHPNLKSIVPSTTETLIDVSGFILLEFNEEVTIPDDDEVNGNNNITFIDSDSNTFDYDDCEISGNYIKIYYNGLSYDTTYSVSFDEHSIVDLSFIEVNISDSSLSDYSIKTIDDPRPQLQYYLPNSDVSNVYLNQPVSLVFSEKVLLDTSGNGRITILDISNNDSTFDYFDMSNNDHVSGHIFGNGTNTIRIYPFDANTSFRSNNGYSLSIDSDALKDICNNYYVGVSDTNTITFTTGDSDGTVLNSLSTNTQANFISDNSGNDYILFNNDNEYNSKQYTLSVGTYIIDVSQSYPLAILNKDISDDVIISISNEPIRIEVSEGTTSAYGSGSTNDYHFFSISGERMSIANGELKFMRGQTYELDGSSMTNNYELIIYYGDASCSLTNTSNQIKTFAIPEDMSTEENSLYYCSKFNDSNYSSNDSSNDVSMTLLYSEVSENNENGNSSYDFYYGNVILDVCGNNFGSFSFYIYDNGYMGGKYTFTFKDIY